MANNSDNALIEAVIALIDSKKDQEAREGPNYYFYREVSQSDLIGSQFSRRLILQQ
jgi:hypothetical protein